MQVFNDELHCGSDFIRRYVADGHDFTGATAVMKVRTENDIELVAADCVIDGDSVTVRIPGERSREIPRRYRMASVRRIRTEARRIQLQARHGRHENCLRRINALKGGIL